jgi:hypothetical protein
MPVLAVVPYVLFRGPMSQVVRTYVQRRGSARVWGRLQYSLSAVRNAFDAVKSGHDAWSHRGLPVEAFGNENV